MEQPRDALLARAGFAVQHHVAVEVGECIDLLHQLQHRRGPSHEVGHIGPRLRRGQQLRHQLADLRAQIGAREIVRQDMLSLIHI